MEITAQMRQKTVDYKKNIASKYMLVEGTKIKSRISGEDFCVTRKIDGHMQCVFYNEGEVAMLNANGKQRGENLKCLEVLAEQMASTDIKSAVFAAELYMPREGGRPRCGDVQSALTCEEGRQQLSLAVYDILEIDGEAFKVGHYKEVHSRMKELLNPMNELCKPVEMRMAASLDEVKDIYDEWVVEEGAEGLVVYNETHIVSKIKQRHSIDAAVIGYTTGDEGVRDLMFAVRREDGLFQMFALGSNGLKEEDRLSLAERLSSMHVESQYVLSDSRGIAYQMVRPELVYEIKVLELVARGNDEKVKMNPLLTFDEAQGWIMNGVTSGVSVIGLALERERTDKTPSITDVRISQLTDLCPFEEINEGVSASQTSQLLERRVFKKSAKEKVMLHKFLIWKTNKEQSGMYPAYIFYHTDYSSSRKEMIKRDMAFSSSEEQIREILAAEIAENVKKGWEEV